MHEQQSPLSSSHSLHIALNVLFKSVKITQKKSRNNRGEKVVIKKSSMKSIRSQQAIKLVRVLRGRNRFVIMSQLVILLLITE